MIRLIHIGFERIGSSGVPLFIEPNAIAAIMALGAASIIKKAGTVPIKPAPKPSAPPVSSKRVLNTANCASHNRYNLRHSHYITAESK